MPQADTGYCGRHQDGASSKRGLHVINSGSSFTLPEMWSIGKHVVVRLLTIFAVLFGILFTLLYNQYGWFGLVALLAGSGISLLGFFATLWERLNKPLSERLQYLNQHAFSPLADWCNASGDSQLNPNRARISEAVEALRSQRRYLTTGLYPKKLLSFAEQLVKDTEEYEPLWYEIYGVHEKWILDHSQEYIQKHSTSPDMRALNFILKVTRYDYPLRPEVLDMIRNFWQFYQGKNPKGSERYVQLSKGFIEKRKDISRILSDYMRANLLHRQATNAFGSLLPV